MYNQLGFKLIIVYYICRHPCGSKLKIKIIFVLHFLYEEDIPLRNSILFHLFSLFHLREKLFSCDFCFSPRFCRSRKNREKRFLRPRQRQGREMFFEVFPTEVTWGKTKITRALIFSKDWQWKE